MLTLAPCSSADVAMALLARLATIPGTTSRQMIRATEDALDAWRKLPEGRQHAMQLRALLAAELAGAIERVYTLPPAEKLKAQGVVDVLRAGVETLGERLALW